MTIKYNNKLNVYREPAVYVVVFKYLGSYTNKVLATLIDNDFTMAYIYSNNSVPIIPVYSRKVFNFSLAFYLFSV